MKFVPNAVSVKLARTILVSQKHSPQTLFAAGIIGIGATIVLACKATLQVEEVLDTHDKDISILNETSVGLRSNTAHHNRELAKAKSLLVLDLGKLYGPAIICGVVSVSALAGSHNILTKRNAGLTAAYGVLEKAFKEYRSRVSNELGEEKERDIYYGLEACEMEDEKGKKVKSKRITQDSERLYARLFNEHNRNWVNNPDYNYIFLRTQQNYLNDLLMARGHVFLNDVYDHLGYERTTPGQVVGWVKNSDGDNFIDFGIFDNDSTAVRDFMIGAEKELLLDFNVDGVIYDKI